MATLIDSVGTQHYANKMVLAENRKVGSKSLPSALADVDNLIEEMKGHFEAEYGSALDMKLENSENIFSVGTGSGIDKRNEVENSFTDIEVFGNSMVNYCTENKTSVRTSDKTGIQYYNYNCVAKPNTIYTLVLNVTKNTTTQDAPKWGIYLDGATMDNRNICGWSVPIEVKKGIVGIVFLKFTSRANLEVNTKGNSIIAIGLHSDYGTGYELEFKDVMLLEGDYTNKQIPPYFEGLKSVGEKEDRNEIEVLSATSLNLINLSNMKYGYRISDSGVSETYPSDSYCDDFIDVRNDKILNYSGGQWKRIVGYDENKKFKKIVYDSSYQEKLITIPNDIFYIKAGMGNPNESHIISQKLQLSFGQHKKPYQINRKIAILDKKQISLSEPLRSLPNGVRDSIEKTNGEWKIVRRCTEEDLSAVTTWNIALTDEYVKGFCSYSGKLGSPVTLCNSLASENRKEAIGYSPERNCVWVWNDSTTQNYIYVCIKKSLLGSHDYKGLVEWLKANQTKLVCELATPVIEGIDSITLQCWKNGTISIDEILPVETTHTVALNKPAQIKRNIEELTILRNKVQALENQYDQIALEQAHKLELLNHSFELDYNI